MESKKHKLAEKKLVGALATFTNAVTEVEKAIELKLESVDLDKNTMLDIENEIQALNNKHDEIQANMIRKQGEVKQHRELVEKLKGFTNSI